jgi:hypothetical protein
MQAITTKYIEATDTKGERVKATATSGQTLTMPWDYEQEAFENHGAVAKALAEKLGWRGEYSGAVLNENGYVFVQHYSQISFAA